MKTKWRWRRWAWPQSARQSKPPHMQERMSPRLLSALHGYPADRSSMRWLPRMKRGCWERRAKGCRTARSWSKGRNTKTKVPSRPHQALVPSLQAQSKEKMGEEYKSSPQIKPQPSNPAPPTPFYHLLQSPASLLESFKVTTNQAFLMHNGI